MPIWDLGEKPYRDLRKERGEMRRVLIAKGFVKGSPKLEWVLSRKMKKKYGQTGR